MLWLTKTLFSRAWFARYFSAFSVASRKYRIFWSFCGCARARCKRAFLRAVQPSSPFSDGGWRYSLFRWSINPCDIFAVFRLHHLANPSMSGGGRTDAGGTQRAVFGAYTASSPQCIWHRRCETLATGDGGSREWRPLADAVGRDVEWVMRALCDVTQTTWRVNARSQWTYSRM